ncbi:MAG: hypothetical protein M3065_08950, partial [Actinomycetota bacterium]|nr:hypothetical protein [Actinomycetota bacterium]
MPQKRWNSGVLAWSHVRVVLPWATVGISAGGLWLATGVAAMEVLGFGLYELVFVFLPGWLVYELLGGTGGVLRRVVLAWSLGYVLEIAAFALTAAVGARGWFIAYPVVFAGLALPVLLAMRRRTRRPRETRGADRGLSSAWVWAVAGLCVLMLGMVALAYFAPNPLPDQVGRVAYGLDHVWNLSLAAEAKHHWPVTDPSVSGTALAYHLFASFDIAATSQVTGLDLAVVFFRLSVVPLLLVFVVELAWAGVIVARRAWAGPVAAVLALCVGELDIAPQIGRSFANELTDDVLGLSPSFLLGAVFFVPALV